MKTEIILISVSLFILLLMVVIRYMSVLYAKDEYDYKLLRSDKFIYFSWIRFVKLYREIRKDITELIKDLPHIILHFLSNFFYYLYKKTKKLVDIIKGNKIKTDGGSVSIFLKKIEKATEK